MRCWWILNDMHNWNESTLAAQRVKDRFMNEVFDATTIDGGAEWRISILRAIELFDLANAGP